MANLAKLKTSFFSGLGLPKDINVVELKYRDIKQWDSVGHMQLVTQIENDFDVMLDSEEVIALSSFTKAKEILTKHGVGFES